MSAVSAAVERQSVMDLQGVLRSLRRYWWLVLACLLVGAGIGSALALEQEPTYESMAQVVLKPERNRQLQAVTDEEQGRESERSYDTERHILLSESVLGLAVEDIGATLPRELERIRDAVSEADTRRWRQIRRLQSMMTVQPVRGTSIVRISATCEEAEDCPRVANAVLDAYVNFVEERHHRAGIEAEDWLRARFLEVSEELEEVEEAMISYRRERGVLSLSLRDEFNTTGRSLQAVTAQLIELEYELDRMRTFAEYAADVRNSERFLSAGLPEVVGNTLIQGLKSRLTELQIERVSQGILLDEEHPQIRAIDEQLALIEDAVEREVSAEMETVELRFEAAQRLARELRGKESSLREEAMELEEQQLVYERLERQARRAAERFDSLEDRLNDVELHNRLDSPQVEVLARAREVREINAIAGPVFAAGGTLVGAALGLLLSVLLYRQHATVESQEEIEDDFGLDFLGVLPRVRKRDVESASGEADVSATYLYPFLQRRSAFAEAARAILNHLLFMKSDTRLRCLLVTSSGPQDGKTTTVTSLAFAIAETGLRCVIVDADLRRPQLHTAFGVRGEPGLVDVLSGRERWGHAVQPSGYEGIDLLVAGRPPQSTSAFLHSDALTDLIDELKDAYDYVLIDSPPISAVADGLALCRCADGVIVVARCNQTRTRVLARTVDRLDAVGAPLVGAVLNGIDPAKLVANGYAAYRYYGEYSGPDEEPETTRS